MQALVLYCGKETKIFLNQGKYHFKTSTVEKRLNIILTFQIFTLFSLAAIMSGRCYHFLKEYGAKMRYIYPKFDPLKNIPAVTASADMAIFYLVLNTLLPIAIVVVLEFVKLVYTRAVEGDADMVIPDDFIKDIRQC